MSKKIKSVLKKNCLQEENTWVNLNMSMMQKNTYHYQTTTLRSLDIYILYIYIYKADPRKQALTAS